MHPKMKTYKFQQQHSEQPTSTPYTSSAFQKAGETVATGMNSIADGINQTSKILSSGILIGSSIAASGIEGVGKIVQSVVPRELTDNPIGAGLGMAAKVGKQAIESST